MVQHFQCNVEGRERERQVAANSNDRKEIPARNKIKALKSSEVRIGADVSTRERSDSEEEVILIDRANGWKNESVLENRRGQLNQYS